MRYLKTVTLSLDIVWTDRDENLFALKSALADIPADADIVVLPELFSTGFINDTDILHRMAEDADDSPTLQELHRLAARHNVAIAGSMLVRDNDLLFNRGFFIEPSGESVFYDKRHLFGPGSEARDLTHGSDPIPVARFRGWNIALAICYDLRFPAWLRNTGYAYDLLIIPANWPDKRAYAWEHLLIARAIENQAYVVGVNRSGQDDYGKYDNMTYAFDFMGKPILSPLTPDSRTAGIAILDHQPLDAYRQVFPADNDADRFTII